MSDILARSAADIFASFARYLERNPRAEIVIGIDREVAPFVAFFCELYSPEIDDANQMMHGVTPQDAAAQLAQWIRMEEV